MILSKETLEVLKNYSNINGSILIKPGNTIATKSQSDSIISYFKAKEEFETEISFYDLNLVLGVISAFTNPVFEFESDRVIISEEKTPSIQNTIIYHSSSFITKVGNITPPPFEVSFQISEDILSKLDKLSSIQNLNEYVFEGVGDKILLKALNVKNPDSNNFSVELGENTLKKPFKMVYNKDWFIFVKGNYTVELSTKRITHFKHNSLDLDYYVMADIKSKI